MKPSRIAWVVADVTSWQPDRHYDVWHDRAVFHFLTEPEQRLAYRHALETGTAPDSAVIIATFAPDGPERCSGLPVQRYDAVALASEFSSTFALQRDWREEHTTPAGGLSSRSSGASFAGAEPSERAAERHDPDDRVYCCLVSRERQSRMKSARSATAIFGSMMMS